MKFFQKFEKERIFPNSSHESRPTPKLIKDASSPQTDLQIPWNPNENSFSFFFLAEIDKLILKFTWKCKTLHSQRTLRNESKVRELTLSNSKTVMKLEN